MMRGEHETQRGRLNKMQYFVNYEADKYFAQWVATERNAKRTNIDLLILLFGSLLLL